MHVRITRRLLDSFHSQTGKVVFHRDTDLPGFGVKLTAAGRVSFIAEARVRRGRTMRLKLGEYPFMSLPEARREALRVLGLLKQGIDLQAQERKAQEAQRAADAVHKAMGVTLGTVVDGFLRDRKLKTEYDYRTTIKNCFGDWLDKPVREITRQAVEARFREIQDRGIAAGGAPRLGQAVKAFKYLASVLGYARAEEVAGVPLLAANPVAVLAGKKIHRTLKPRTRYIQDEDLWKVMRAIDSLASTAHRRYLLLLLYTGIRRTEGLTLEWPNVNLDPSPRGGYFVVEDTKNGLDHVVPMSSPVRVLFTALWADRGRASPWVFPSAYGACTGPLRAPRRAIAWVAEAAEVEFTAHDLRRTFASVAHACGLDPLTIKRAMNHKARDITERYIQTRADRLREPMEEIAQYIRQACLDHESAFVDAHCGAGHYERCYWATGRAT